MLPGFRFLFAAIILSVSILIFGLGAAALLRTAHEEFASAPAWQPAPETRFAQAGDATKEAANPVLALLRVDAAPKVEAPAPGPDASGPDLGPDLGPNLSDAAPTEPAASPAGGQIGALPQQDSSPADAAKTEAPAADTTAAELPAAEQTVAASLPSETVASASEAAPAAADTSSVGETKVSTTAPSAAPEGESVSPVAAEATPAAPEQASVPNLPSPALSDASKTIATLGGPAVTIAVATPANPDAAKPDKSALRKRLQARRAIARHKAAARAVHHASQQPVDLFGQPVAR